MTSVAAVGMSTILASFGAGAIAPTANAASPVSGGTMTILENTNGIGNWPAGLDPGTNNCCLVENEPFNDAIFGQLFTQSPKGHAEPDLATGFKFSDGNRVVSIFLRHNVKFTDGTPFDAAAVKFNIDRDLKLRASTLISSFPVKKTTTEGKYTVVLHLLYPFSPIINSFDSIIGPNWIISPTALQKEGEKKMSLYPVGAGPFMVKTDVQNSKLVLVKNPNYWQKGHPYLDGVTFETVGTDQSAYSAVLSGEAQVVQQVATSSTAIAAQKNPAVRVVTSHNPATGSLQLNTKIPPFNNIKAREAVYYALNQALLNKVAAAGQGAVSQTGDGPTSLFPILKVPGYRTYNPAKARALVKQLGGLSFTITGFATNPVLSEAEQSEFAAAGMKTKIDPVNLAQLVAAFRSGKWQITGGGAGGLDPAIGVGGMTWRVQSNAPFTGIHDKTLDKLIATGAATTDPEKRLGIYKQIFKYMSDQALMPFTYAAAQWNVSNPKAMGPGLSIPMYNNYLIQWPDIWMAH
ncbi:MAG: ABC transporter substrate-binding protein [Acidimicrobiaceae bacterium]|nr:ABC transporter substrate-binding protein [Acidimicrobiaceae bacterium]